MSAEWNFLITLNERLRPVKDAVERQAVAVRLIGEYLHANRVNYAHIDGDVWVIDQSYADGVEPFAGRGPITQFGKATAEAGRRGETIAITDIRTDARFTDAEREPMLAHQIVAFVGVPVMKDGRRVAVFGVHSATPRSWTRDQIALIEVTAERTWGAGERARAEEALDRSRDRRSFLQHLSDTIRPLADPTRILQETCRLLGTHLRANRVVYGAVDGDACMIAHDYVDGVPSLAGHLMWRNLVGSLADQILAGRTLLSNDTSSDAHTAEERAALEAAEVGAYMSPVLIKDGRFVGGFGIHSRSPRVWTTDEIALAQEVADRVWATVEHRNAEADLRANEERLRLALEATAGGSWTWDFRTNETYWDATFRDRFGFGPEEHPQFDTWLERVHVEDRARMRTHLEEVLATKDRWDSSYRLMHPEIGLRWMQSLGRAHRDAAGRVTRLSGLELDITDRRRTEDAEQARRDEEYNRTLRTLLETSTQGIVAADTRGILIFANRAVEVMFGSPADELVGQPIERLIPSILAGGLASVLNLTGRRKDGSSFPIDVTVTHVPTPSGVRTFAFVTDITERQLVAAALQERTSELEYRTTQLSQMAWDLTLAEHHAREQIARTLHDGLQQLLVIVALNLDQELKRDTGAAPSELVTEAKQQIDEAIDVARSLNVELFPPVLQRSGLPAALTWLANWARDKYKLTVEVSVDARADSARKDVRTLLFESVRELLFNAVKYAKTDRVTLALSVNAHDELCIRVTDDGVGFEPSKLDDRSKLPPAGWGLFRMRERLTLLGGRMDIDSAPGRGTTVRLVAPRAANPDGVGQLDVPDRVVTGIAPSFDNDRDSVGSLRILLVDDHPAVRRALRDLLHQPPQLSIVGDAANGLEAIAQAHALLPDVILMDIAMPRMDGIEATARLHRELPGIRILGLSTLSRSEGADAMERAGAAGFFVKGTDTPRLIDELLTYHASRVAARAGR